MKVFIQYTECSVDVCLSEIIDKSCQSPLNQRSLTIEMNRINDFQTQFISYESQTMKDPFIAYQYVCCYEQNGLFILSKALTALARKMKIKTTISIYTYMYIFFPGHRNMFVVHKPEFSLVTGDILKYRCEAHDLIYDDLRIIFNDGLFTYERNRFDPEWYLYRTHQPKRVGIEWSTPTRFVSFVIISAAKFFGIMFNAIPN